MERAKWLCFQFNNPTKFELISALMSTENWNNVKLIKLSFKSCPNSEKYAEIALTTSRNTYNSKIGIVIKRQFYRCQYNWIYRKLLNSQIDYVACFNGLKGVDGLVVAACRELKIPVLFFEFASLVGRVQIDWKGINFDSSIPRDSNFYRNSAESFHEVNWRNSVPISRQVIKNPSVQQIKDVDGILEKQKFIFCPLQVPKDSQLTVHGGWVEGNFDFLNCIDKMTAYLPSKTHFRIKEHPSSKVSLRRHIAKLNNPNIKLDNTTDTMDLVSYSIAVMTINSSVGLEAFYFGKPVITLGNAFYSFGNLTSRAKNLSQLASLIKSVEKIQFSEKDRDLFMRFLHFWYPKIECIINGKFTLKELDAQYAWLEKGTNNSIQI